MDDNLKKAIKLLYAPKVDIGVLPVRQPFPTANKAIWSLCNEYSNRNIRGYERLPNG